VFSSGPSTAAAGDIHRISDLELASRLSFFLWSSIPDDELLDLASKGRLKDPVVLEKQVRRMLADPRSNSLVTNFGGQWLFLRELKNATPASPEFDDNLRQSSGGDGTVPEALFGRTASLIFSMRITRKDDVWPGLWYSQRLWQPGSAA
jgi:hypothetical protein